MRSRAPRFLTPSFLVAVLDRPCCRKGCATGVRFREAVVVKRVPLRELRSSLCNPEGAGRGFGELPHALFVWTFSVSPDLPSLIYVSRLSAPQQLRASVRFTLSPFHVGFLLARVSFASTRRMCALFDEDAHTHARILHATCQPKTLVFVREKRQFQHCNRRSRLISSGQTTKVAHKDVITEL
jgi:hypothetical protein